MLDCVWRFCLCFLCGAAFGPAAWADVRVWGLVDMNWSDAASTVNSPWGVLPGQGRLFCVANTAGGGVRLTLSNTHGAGPGVLRARAATGATLDYHLGIADARTGAWYINAFGVGAMGVDLPASALQTHTSTCTAAKLRLTLVLPGGASPPGNNQYTDALTITVSPQ